MTFRTIGLQKPIIRERVQETRASSLVGEGGRERREPKRGLSSSAPLGLNTPWCGCSILTTAPPWSVRGTSTLSACGKAVPGPAKPYPALPASLASWTRAAHATCCALGEATRGHNAVIALIHAAAQFCDHTAETKVLGLILGTDLSPPTS